MRWSVWGVILLSSVCPTSSNVNPRSESTQEERTALENGCEEGMPPPDHPFKVVWNHPDSCEWKGVPLNLRLYNITFNTNRLFLGDHIQTIYDTGLWPTIDENGTSHNGGLPQLYRDTKFQATWDTLNKLRVSTFSGLGVLDFEDWRAVWETNYGSMWRYRHKSWALVKSQHPDYDHSTVDKVAERQWNDAAKRIFSAKLAVAQTIYPGGYWGYYNYPRGWSKSTVQRNNKMSWLFRQATGLYPSIYYFEENENRVTDYVAEAVRIQQTFSPPNTGIFVYARTYPEYPKEYLQNVLSLPADMGASGVVIWGSSEFYRNPEACHNMQSFVANDLGPFVKNLTLFTSDCSLSLCGGHGRCVHNDKDSVLNSTQSLHLSTQCGARDSRFSLYHCRCYHPYGGPCCHTRMPPKCKSTASVIHSTKQPDWIG